MEIKIEWGKITVDGKEYHDIIVADGKVFGREYEKIKEKYGTSHVVDGEEAKLLLEGNPNEIIIGNGYQGALKLTEEAETLLRESSLVSIYNSEEAVKITNEKLKKKESFSALVHSTC